MTTQQAQQPDESKDELEDEACGDNHSWEYLYSVYSCANCGTVTEDD